jgi:hypothetical protein
MVQKECREREVRNKMLKSLCEVFLHTGEVVGSIPTAPTTKGAGFAGFFESYGFCQSTNRNGTRWTSKSLTL